MPPSFPPSDHHTPCTCSSIHSSSTKSRTMPTSSRSSRRPPSCMTCSLLTPCKRALKRLFRIPASAALSIRAFRFCSLRKTAAKMRPRGGRHRRTYRSVSAVFWPLIPATSSSTPATSLERDTARREAAASPPAAAETPPVLAPLPSPETPAYVKMVTRLRSRTSVVGEEACRSFESCLMDILMEEGKARDLQDVEELLQCWEKLKSPVFVDLVCRFYGDLCKDVFKSSVGAEEDESIDKNVGSVSTSAA